MRAGLLPPPPGQNPRPVGLLALIEELNLSIPLPAVCSFVVDGQRTTHEQRGRTLQCYPPRYEPRDQRGHLAFALRYEPIHLGIWKPLCQSIDPDILLAWLAEEPQGIYARKAWYLFELLTGNCLDIPDLSAKVNFQPLLDARRQFVGDTIRVGRQRIVDNLLGTSEFCPMIRRTAFLEAFSELKVQEELQALQSQTEPSLLSRTINYLYAKETRSSFEIEHEKPSALKAARFIEALSHSDEIDINSEQGLTSLQNLIIDPRYAEPGWRNLQNYVGESRIQGEHVHFVPPKPDDIPSLMKGWFRSVERLQAAGALPAAAAAGFGFVFIHPFNDGNGRIHRFVIHKSLTGHGLTPKGMIIPVSAVMLRDLQAYSHALEAYSKSVMPFIDYRFTPQGRVEVFNDTADLYRYFDATVQTEYLCQCVLEAIKKDLVEEIRYLKVFDEASARIQEIIDMPNKDQSLLIRLIIQNNGKLSKSKRGMFSKLRDDEIRMIEEAVQTAGIG